LVSFTRNHYTLHSRYILRWTPIVRQPEPLVKV
jgi:hypothetical protein